MQRTKTSLLAAGLFFAMANPSAAQDCVDPTDVTCPPVSADVVQPQAVPIVDGPADPNTNALATQTPLQNAVPAGLGVLAIFLLANASSSAAASSGSF